MLLDYAWCTGGGQFDTVIENDRRFFRERFFETDQIRSPIHARFGLTSLPVLTYSSCFPRSAASVDVSAYDMDVRSAPRVVNQQATSGKRGPGAGARSVADASRSIRSDPSVPKHPRRVVTTRPSRACSEPAFG